jgi:hypothetical protein
MHITYVWSASVFAFQSWISCFSLTVTSHRLPTAYSAHSWPSQILTPLQRLNGYWNVLWRWYTDVRCDGELHISLFDFYSIFSPILHFCLLMPLPLFTFIPTIQFLPITVYSMYLYCTAHPQLSYQVFKP